MVKKFKKAGLLYSCVVAMMGLLVCSVLLFGIPQEASAVPEWSTDGTCVECHPEMTDVGPTETTEPSELAEPEESAEPTEPAEPIEMSDPAEPSGLSESEEPSEPTDPAQPTEPEAFSETVQPEGQSGINPLLIIGIVIVGGIIAGAVYLNKRSKE